MAQQEKDEEQLALGIGKQGDVEDRILRGKDCLCLPCLWHATD